jgi:hypothetical protein
MWGRTGTLGITPKREIEGSYMMTDQEQWKQDFERARHYRDALDEIAGMKIPYCDAYDVANSMRDVAKEAIQNFLPEESRLWARISELEVCIRQMCNSALDLGYCDMRDCHDCKTFKVCGVEE